MPELSISVMHAPFSLQRREMLARLLGLLEREHGLFVGPGLIMDHERAGPWPTARRGWIWGAAQATRWHLQLQDDALPCRNFVAGLLAALHALPHPEIVAPYSPRAVILKAKRSGSSWAWIPDGCAGVAICLPHEFIEPFLDWEQKALSPDYDRNCDDSRVNLWAMETFHDVWATAPSLIEHADSNQSLIQGGAERRARWFIGEDQSALEVDWTRGLEMPPMESPFLGFPVRHYIPRERRAL